MTLLALSAMKRSPLASKATPHGDAQLAARGRSTVAAVAAAKVVVSCHRGDQARGEIDLANDVVAAVGDEEVAAASTATPPGSLLGAGGRSAVAAVAAASRQFPATVVIRPVERSTSRMTLLPLSAMKRSPAAVYCDGVGKAILRTGGRPAVAAIAIGARCPRPW